MLYEILSMGAVPYADVEPEDMCAHLQAGNRQQAPECYKDTFVN